ncbi:hypothetical protein AYI70_g1532 [Smittium culicis]|uniref:Uncharacterized protein n=1 Tax=Smittium culicis TaxID=133412 RepID=A0A1R1YC83_9FUNG|nr:hypothetical protein AYI70_g1532 [Smittium culicis]
MKHLIPNFFDRVGATTHIKNEMIKKGLDPISSLDHSAISDYALGKIHIRLYLHEKQLSFGLIHQLPKFVADNNIKLVIIDSIAALMRFQLDETDDNPNSDDINLHNPVYIKSNGPLSSNPKNWFNERDSKLLLISKSLKNIAYQNNCAVICVNQVTDNFSLDQLYLYQEPQNNLTTQPFISKPNYLKKVAVLGKHWGSSVNTRVFFHLKRSSHNMLRSNDQNNGSSFQLATNNTKNKRWIEGTNIPWKKPTICEFEIDNSGIHSL